MKALFLDIDGVCNNDTTREISCDGFCFVEDKLVRKIKKIIDATGAKIVLSSSWREEWDIKDETKTSYAFIELRDKFSQFGLTFWDKTGVWRKTRGEEIEEYLLLHPEISQFAIIDDYADMGRLCKFLIKTDGTIGITDEDVVEIIGLLGNK